MNVQLVCPGIRAARVPSYSPGSIAEYAVAQMLALAKELVVILEVFIKESVDTTSSPPSYWK